MEHPLVSLIDELIVLNNKIIEVSKVQFPHSTLNIHQRRMLRSISRHCPITCADLARNRHISRQYACKIVGQLEEAGLVESLVNPSHRRSPLIDLTEGGRSYIERHNRAIAGFATDEFGLCGTDLEELRTLRRLIGCISGAADQWLLTQAVKSDDRTECDVTPSRNVA